MASKMEYHDAVVEQITAEDDSYAVQPVDSKSSVPVDGPVSEADDSPAIKSAPDHDGSSDSDQPALDSPFHSPKSAPEDCMSDTTLEEGEIADDLLERHPAAAIGGTEGKEGGAEVVVLEAEVKDLDDENGTSGRL
jgi:hypothetical protein